jgi:hypothetical protein
MQVDEVVAITAQELPLAAVVVPQEIIKKTLAILVLENL